METFWFWFMKSAAEMAFALAAIFFIGAAYALASIVLVYLVGPYNDYKNKRLWMSKDFSWVESEYRYHYARRYSAYSEWKNWMQEVYDTKRRQLDE